MTKLGISPYFHPTTVVFVDDNLDFLSNLSLQLDADLAYRLFDSPSDALDYLNAANHANSVSDRFFAAISDNPDGIASEPLLRVDLAAIQREVRNTERFAETAVVIVDYAMPQMNGLEFCERITNPHIKKVLFTGDADQEIAVRAFNNGTIDRFIRKGQRKVYTEVNSAIDALQESYIRDTVRSISQILALHKRDFLMDAAFAQFFNQFRKERGFVEYYLSIEPSGFLLLDADGRAARLLALTDAELELHCEMARAQGAPQGLLDALIDRDRVPYFDTSPDGFYRRQCTDWRACLHPAQTLDGDKRYYWALITDGNAATNLVASYGSYLDWLDSTSYALI